MLQRIKSLLHFLGVDRAVFYCNATQMLRLATGPLTMFLVLRYLTPEVQGYFYTFSSIVAMQVFLEMGFSQNILQFASHEFAKLHFTPQNSLEGDPRAKSRIISLGRLAFKYYLIASLCMMVLIGAGGYLFFSLSGSHGVHWQGAWWIIAITASLSLALNPAWALLEGCNRVVEIARFRLWATGLGFLVNVASFILGAGIYVTAIAAAFSLLFSFSYILWFWRPFLRQFCTHPEGEKISWKNEIWPFQWRIAVSWISGYFIFSIVNPVVFFFCGAADAGRFGMSFQIMRMVSGVAMSWVSTKAPRFGMLMAEKKWTELHHLFRRSTVQALGMGIFGVVGLLAAVPLAGFYFPQVPVRLASMPAMTWMGISIITQILVSSLAFLLRANKQEPYMGISVWNAILSVLFMLPMARFWGIDGVALGYMLVAIIMAVPAVLIYREKWREYQRGDALRMVSPLKS